MELFARSERPVTQAPGLLRRKAIAQALRLAQAGDLVLITGKGSEQAICVADGKKIPWDDRKIVREELCNL